MYYIQVKDLRGKEHARARARLQGERRRKRIGYLHVHAERFMVTVGTFRVKGSVSQDVSVSEESPKKEKKKKKGLRTPSFLKKKKEKKKPVEAQVVLTLVRIYMLNIIMGIESFSNIQFLYNSRLHINFFYIFFSFSRLLIIIVLSHTHRCYTSKIDKIIHTRKI